MRFLQIKVMKIKILLFLVIISKGALSDNGLFSKVGLNFGVTRSAQSWDNGIDIGKYRNWGNSMYSIFIGLNYNQPLSKKVFLSFALQHIEKGFKTSYKHTFSSSNLSTKYAYSLNYWEVPITINYHNPKSNFTYNIGMYMSYLYQANYIFEETEEIRPNGSVIATRYTSFAKEMKDGINRFDFGMFLGISRELNKYLAGTFSVTKGFISPNVKFFEDLKYNQTFSLGLNYYFLR